MNSNQINQRDTFRLVEKMISGDNPDVITMLKAIVTDIVDLDHFEIIGGRIWELNAGNNSYKLKFQHGKFNKVPEEYEIKVEDQPILKDLPIKHVMLSNETDFLLQELGIKLYSVIGVGSIVKTKTGRCYEYVIGFNAPEIHQSFFELLNIIAGVTTTEIANIKRKLHERDSQNKFRRDLDKAAEIQRKLLPEHTYKFNDFDIYGVCLLSEGVGGDYFDYIIRDDIDNDSLGIVISDSASHGLIAAVQSNFVSGAIRMGLSYTTRIVDIFNKLNTLIFDKFLYERFVTLFYCEITLSDNRLVLYVNAGHPAPIHFRPHKDSIKLLKPTGGMLGILQKQKFGLENIRMQVDDVLVLYTDGITEAMDSKENVFGEDRLQELIKKHHKLTAKEITLNILEDVQKFAAKSNHTDDRTLVVIKRERADSTKK